MIQDIFPKVYHNEYYEKTPDLNNFILIFRDNKVMIRFEEEKIRYPRMKELPEKLRIIEDAYVYLFSIDTSDYFLYLGSETEEFADYHYESLQSFRTTVSKHTAFAGITAHHLYIWYKNNHFCGRCGHETTPDTKERMLKCKFCGNMIYPRISSAVIVAVTDKDKLLMSKYNGREYTKYALLAGFSEIGETLEDTVHREVMEEVGLKVKNLRYYKSQPWAFSESLLVGFFAELDGSNEIRLEENELSEAGWFTADQVTLEDDGISLTREMMKQWKDTVKS